MYLWTKQIKLLICLIFIQVCFFALLIPRFRAAALIKYEANVDSSNSTEDSQPLFSHVGTNFDSNATVPSRTTRPPPASTKHPEPSWSLNFEPLPLPNKDMEESVRNYTAGLKDDYSSYKTAIIIPYRDRLSNLSVLLRNMHPFLQYQRIDYHFYIVEPIANDTFNRAKLANVGFMEAMKESEYDCFIVHDVDALPEKLQNRYECTEMVFKHFTSASNRDNYTLFYSTHLGGVTGFTAFSFVKVNGFSNSYWGWGAEDDDLANRVRINGLKLEHNPQKLGRYTLLLHERKKEKHNEANPCNDELREMTGKRWREDGLNTLRYLRVGRPTHPLERVTWIKVNLLERESRVLLANLTGLSNGCRQMHRNLIA